MAVQLVAVRGALAHSDHYESESAEPVDAPVAIEQPSPSPKPAAAIEGNSTNMTDGSEADIVSPDNSLDKKIEKDTTLQEISAGQTAASSSEAGLLDGFSIGLGESLLALIVASPFLLISMKQRSHS